MIQAKRILVPVDFSKESHLAVEWAVKLGNEEPEEITLYLLHVVPFTPIIPEPGVALPDILPDQFEEAKAELEKWQSKVPPQLASIPLCGRGDPLEEIKRVCELESIDLVVMTTHGRQGLSRVVKPNLTEKVVRWAPCPVLVLHLNQPGMVSQERHLVRQVS